MQQFFVTAPSQLRLGSPYSPEVGKLTPAESAGEIISSAIEEFGDSLAVLTSFQREGVIIVDLVRKIAPRIPIITLDTGRLPVATYEAIGMVETRYGISVERVLPDSGEVDAMVSAHGANLFRDSVPQRMLCCNVRKVRPLATRMASTSAYFTGIRREQNEERENVPVFDRSGRPVKISPLAIGPKLTLRNIPGSTNFPCTPCIRKAIGVSGAIHVRGRCGQVKMSEPGAGGGKTMPQRNAAFISAPTDVPSVLWTCYFAICWNGR